MGGVLECLGCETEPPTPLDTEIDEPGSCCVSLLEGGKRTQRVLGFPLRGARRPNFDFITHDNGETYIATFRATNVRGKVLGRDSNPIPKAVYDEFRIIKKYKSGSIYGILLHTNDHNLDPYVDKTTEEDYEKLGIAEEDRPPHVL